MMNAIGAGGWSTGESALPWTLPARFTMAPPIAVEGPKLETSDVSDRDGKHVVKGIVSSPRGASTIALFFPTVTGGRRIEVKVGGLYAFRRTVAKGSVVGILALPKEGIEIELSANGPQKIDFTILDRSFDVPPGSKAEAAVRARPPTATNFQDGDVTIVTTAASF